MTFKQVELHVYHLMFGNKMATAVTVPVYFRLDSSLLYSHFLFNCFMF